MPKSARPFVLLALLSAFLVGCTPDPTLIGGAQTFNLPEEVRNITYGYRRVHYTLTDTAYWNRLMAEADTTVLLEEHGLAVGRKFRNAGIWYTLRRRPDGWRANEPYPRTERGFDTVAHNVNLMVTGRSIAQVTIPAADVVLNGDSVRIAVIHEQQPAYEQNFEEHQPQPDRLLLTNWGNDTMPIASDMECLGPITGQTAFRVGKHYYGLRYLSADYDAITIEEIADGRHLPLTAELDLTFRQVSVKDLNGEPTTIKRTPGRDLIIYFYGGFRGDERALRVDSLYRTLPAAQRSRIDLAFVSRFGMQRAKMVEFGQSTAVVDSLSNVYLQSELTCRRLNCVSYVPYAVLVDGRGRIASFHTSGKELEAYLRARPRVPGK